MAIEVSVVGFLLSLLSKTAFMIGMCQQTTMDGVVNMSVKMIRLTGQDNKIMYVNPYKIAYFFFSVHWTTIEFENGTSIKVEETPEELCRILDYV
jgi:uncharacterized protein YlzI (FlbEa/FlbD family)